MSSAYPRHIARSNRDRRAGRISRRLPSSHSTADSRPSPGIFTASVASPIPPLWGPALWEALRASETGPVERGTPTPSHRSPTERRGAKPNSSVETTPSPGPVALPQAQALSAKKVCTRLPAGFKDESDSSSGELRTITVIKRERQDSRLNGSRHSIRPSIEYEDMAPTTRTKKAEKTAAKTVKYNAVIPRKRISDDSAGSSSKKHNPGRPAPEGSSNTPVLLESSDDDIPLAHPLSRRAAPGASPQGSKREPSSHRTFFSGLGRRGSACSLPKSNTVADRGARKSESANEFGALQTSDLSVSPDHQRERSPSRLFELYQRSVTGESLNRIAELEKELASCKLDYEARISRLGHEHEVNLRQKEDDHASEIQQKDLVHAAAMQDKNKDHEARIEQLTGEHKKQLQEAKDLLDGIQRTAVKQYDAEAKKVVALESENQALKIKLTALESEKQLLKSQLGTVKTTDSQFSKSVDETEIVVDSDIPVKTPEAEKSVGRQQDEVPGLLIPWRERERGLLLSPTPTFPPSLHPSDETKTSNVRKMFASVKRQHDQLYGICKKLLDLMSGMDLVAFGSFGAQVMALQRLLQSTQYHDGGGGGTGGGSQQTGVV